VSARPRILVAGVGNVFLGDDAFGVEVAQRLLRRAMPEGVRVKDFGIRGFDLAYTLSDMANGEVAILVDALPRGEPPGTLYVLEPDLATLGEPGTADEAIDTHGMNPLRVLQLAKALGGHPPRVLVLGCEPASLDPDLEEGQMGLSGPVQAAVEPAIEMVESLVARLLAEDHDVTQASVEHADHPALAQKKKGSSHA
jgi:hydrogenase maturation protease